MSTRDFASEPWTHPAISKGHLVTHTRDYPNGVAYNVATCACGWSHRETVEETSARWSRAKAEDRNPRDDAVQAHWRGVIAELGDMLA